MLTPDDLPTPVAQKSIVTHNYPEDWDEEQIDKHRYDMCPCSPKMSQCLGHGDQYHWWVYHRRRL